MFLENKNNYFNTNQLKFKIINVPIKVKLQKIELNINMIGIDSFSNYMILESFALLEFFCKQKAAVNSFKQKYKSVNIQLIIHLKISTLFYFYKVFKLFYLPNNRRQNYLFFFSQIFILKFMFSIFNVNFIPFMTNLYLKWKLLLNVIFFFNKNSISQILLLLNYWGFFIVEEEEYFFYNLTEDKEIINQVDVLNSNVYDG